MKARKAPPEPQGKASEAWNRVPWKKLEQHCFRIQSASTEPVVFCKGKVGQFLTETFTKEHIDKNEPIPEK